MEMAAGNYVLAMTSVGDTEEGFARLEKALFELDESLEKKVSEEMNIKPPKSELVYTTTQMKRMKKCKRRSGIRTSVEREYRFYFYGVCVSVSAGDAYDCAGRADYKRNHRCASSV